MIQFPYELFNQLPVEESGKLADKMMNIYFTENPNLLQEIIDRAEGNTDLVNLYKEEEFNTILQQEYAYEIEILSNRINDPLAMALVDAINTYNVQIERSTM